MLRRWAGWGCAVVVAVVAVRLITGPWLAAALMAVVAVIGLVAAIAVIETHTFGRERRPPSVAVVVPDRPGPSPSEHLAYARALAVVVASYVAECEREAGLR
jgi:hypothetical protein